MKSVFASACEGESEKITNNKGRLSKRLSALFSETILFSSEIIRGAGTKSSSCDEEEEDGDDSSCSDRRGFYAYSPLAHPMDP